MYRFGLLFLILSGAAALIYQVTWVRLLGLSMGSTSASVGTVLAAFFLGMSLGSYLARFIVRGPIPTLWPYAVLEACIGLCGLLSLPALLHLNQFMAAFPALGQQLPFKFAVALTLLAVPSACIGATFPIMAIVLIRAQEEIGERLGALYSVNTLGAVLGAVGSGFVLIPWIGLDGAIFFAAALNGVVALGATLLARRLGPPVPIGIEADPQPPLRAAERHRTLALMVLFLTGFTSIAAEVGYTKYVSIFAGTTIFGFSAILAVFLVGIALGAWWIRSRIDRVMQPVVWVAGALLLLGVSLAVSRAALNLLPALELWLDGTGAPLWANRVARYGSVFALLLAPTCLFGALFPLNLRLYCGSLAGVRGNTGAGYAVNTVGGILGSVLAGFYIIPAFGTDLLLSGTAGLILAAGTALALLAPASPRRWLAVATALGVVALVALPGVRYEAIVMNGQRDLNSRLEAADFRFLKEGRMAVVSMFPVSDPGWLRLTSNRLAESEIREDRPNHGAGNNVLLAALPYLLHPDPRTAFQVGFGGGITAYSLTRTDLEVIEIAEIEPVILEAVRTLHGGRIPALTDPRVQLHIGDARNILLLRDRSYDLIVSQPSHPWVAGMAGMFTHEFYRLAASRLNRGGITIQWLNLFRMDVDTLGSILNAFYRTFPHGMVFGAGLDFERKTGALFLVGSTEPVMFDPERVASRLARPRVQGTQIASLIPDAYGLFDYYLLSRAEALALARQAPVNTDTNIFSEVRLASMGLKASPEADPFSEILRHARFNIADYLGDAPASRLYRLGTVLNSRGQYPLAERVLERLAEIDPSKARALRHKQFITSLHYDKAATLYSAHRDWPDETHLGQAVAFTEVGRFAEAKEIIGRIQDAAMRGLAQTRLLLAQRRWTELAALEPLSLEQRAWQLLGLAESDFMAAGRELEQLARSHPDLLDIPHWLTLARYQSRLPERSSVPDARQQLVAKIERQLKSLDRLFEDALQRREPRRAALVVHKVESITRPDWPQARQMRERLAETFPTIGKS